MLSSCQINRISRSGRVAAITLCALVAVCAARTSVLAAPTLDQLAADFGIAKDDIQRVRSGEMVNESTTATSDRELALIMMFLVKAPVQELIGSVKEGPSARNDPQVQSVAEISGAGTLDDFEAVVLQPDGTKEAQRYLSAAPGDTLNLSMPEIDALAALKTSGAAGQAQVEDAVRRLLLGRYQAYRAQGLAGIAPYARGKDKQSQAADDLRRETQASKGIAKYAPAFHATMLNYPQGVPSGLTQQFYCIRYAMSGRPNFVLRHRMAMPLDDAYVVVDRDFYVSSGYNDTQSLAAFMPVENGTVVVYLNRTTTDQLGGFGASAKQSIGRGIMAKQIGAIFEKARAGFKN